MIIRIQTVLDIATRSSSVHALHFPSDIDAPCSNSWTPPELKWSHQELPVSSAALPQRQQQTRNFVWHAGFLEQTEVKELEANIKLSMTTLEEMILQLPSEKATADTGSGNNNNITPTLSCYHDLMEQILQQENLILRLCQEYQRLTGEESDALPQPNCDESSTVLVMEA
jgi:hypothetical protein